MRVFHELGTFSLTTGVVFGSQLFICSFLEIWYEIKCGESWGYTAKKQKWAFMSTINRSSLNFKAEFIRVHSSWTLRANHVPQKSHLAQITDDEVVSSIQRHTKRLVDWECVNFRLCTRIRIGKHVRTTGGKHILIMIHPAATTGRGTFYPCFNRRK